MRLNERLDAYLAVFDEAFEKENWTACIRLRDDLLANEIGFVTSDLNEALEAIGKHSEPGCKLGISDSVVRSLKQWHPDDCRLWPVGVKHRYKTEGGFLLEHDHDFIVAKTLTRRSGSSIVEDFFNDIREKELARSENVASFCENADHSKLHYSHQRDYEHDDTDYTNACGYTALGPSMENQPSSRTGIASNTATQACREAG